MDLPKRKPLRLKNYNYSQNGCYFLTICTQNRTCLFGNVTNGEMKLNKFGIIAQDNIKKIDTLYDDIFIDKYIVMPNHIHLIVANRNENIAFISGSERSKEQLSKIMQSFKAAVTKEIRKTVETEETMYSDKNKTSGIPFISSNEKIWQKSFYDHIIRNEEDYHEIWQYIDSNVQKWEMDIFRKM